MKRCQIIDDIGRRCTEPAEATYEYFGCEERYTWTVGQALIDVCPKHLGRLPQQAVLK